MEEFDFIWGALKPTHLPDVMVLDEISPCPSEWIASPEKMYTYALRSRKRLPDEFHNAMMMWAYDPNYKQYVVMYLEWVKHCEDMEGCRARMRRREMVGDKVLFSSTAMSFLALVLVLAWKAFNG
jgi:hypothetical protein